MENVTPTRSPRCCRICYQPMRGRSHERCQLLGYENRQYAFRQEEDEDARSPSPSDATSSASSSTESVFSARVLRSYASPPSTPPSKPPSSASGSSFSDAFSALTTSAEKEVLCALAPPPPVYPPTVLSDASWEVPETGSFHHVNRRYVHSVPVPQVPPSVVGSIASTAPVSTGDAITEVSMNLRGASPGPSAHAFMAQSDDGSVGPCLSERMEMSRRRNVPSVANSVMTARPGQQFSGRTLQPDENAQNESNTSPVTKPFWASNASVVENQYPYWPAGMTTPPPTPSRRVSIPFSSISIIEPALDRGLDAATEFAMKFGETPWASQIGRLALQFGVCFVASVVGTYVTKQYL